MARYNDGIVRTNDNCIACNLCRAVCPVIGANVSVYKSGISHIEVSAKKCINCGRCLSACSHNSREFIDDTQLFFEDLRISRPISLIVDPTFYTIYGSKARMILGYLKSLGVEKIYDVAVGAEISAWLQAKYIKEHSGEDDSSEAYILQTCPAVVSYAQRCLPELLPLLVPVENPPVCTAIYVKKYLGDTNYLAYLTPCLAGEENTENIRKDNLIGYNVTYGHLNKWLKHIPIENYSAEPDLKTKGLGNISDIDSGFNECVGQYFPEYITRMYMDDIGLSLPSFFEGCTKIGANGHPVILNAVACKGGCMIGAATGDLLKTTEGIFDTYKVIRKEAFEQSAGMDYKQKYEAASQKYAELNIDDFTKDFDENFRQPFIIPESTYDDIFNAMHKDTPEKRNINCSSCGYSSCRNMVTAIANGYVHMQDCIHYLNDDLRYKMATDMQTGLPNAKAFETNCEELIRTNPYSKYVLCVCNINKLRVVNELYDSSVGDKVIYYVAREINDFCENRGTCACLGGGLFSMCFEYSRENMMTLMQRESFDCTHLGINFPVTARMGLYIIEKTNENIAEIINLASFTMDKITNRTENTFLMYTDDMKRELALDAEITAQMKNAMVNREFVLYLQPQYNHITGKLVGAETLSRWIKSDGSMISPGVFIPIFEKNGFIKDMDHYIWECAFALIKRWNDSGVKSVPISTNVSRMSIMTDEIVDTIEGLQEKYKIDPSQLHFEITESAYIENQKELIERVRKIRDMGFKIAMDDFGSGYSSLNTLKDVPLDILKLDMGFLRGNSNNEKGGSIIGHMISMAHSMNLVTIAEGVETVEQADFLKSLGCEIIQGYLYAKPMPVEQYEDILKNIGRDVERPIQKKKTKLNVSHLFNKTSGESVIFENYAGAAGVFELEKDDVVPIRINDRLLEILRETGIDPNNLKSTLLRKLKGEDVEKMKESLQKTVLTGEESVLKFEFVTAAGKKAKFKEHMWKVGTNGNKSVLYVIIENISDD
ncbi:MAG: EAL domain-containing protein [Clostridia bacterium]|nr:EAL domain-containing protein [Clostridia bacterium]